MSTTTNTETPTADRIAMLLGGGLVLLGTVVLGLLNTLAGAPALPVEEDGAIVAEPLVSPDLRAYVIALGLLIWLLFAIYKLTRTPSVDVDDARRPHPAD
ncbi:hypothetical protein ACFQGT_11070 [Natrialbaceae archaeon GCM10025810]|uniref:hypothetical protein n=1 Tax=Halovalidus salilacus TaxID=3075124 RepID=UPI00360B1814